MNIEEFNDRYEIIVDSIASTQLELVQYDLDGTNKIDMDYIRLMDGQTNFLYRVVDKESLKEVLVVKTDYDSKAVSKIKHYFNIS